MIMWEYIANLGSSWPLHLNDTSAMCRPKILKLDSITPGMGSIILCFSLLSVSPINVPFVSKLFFMSISYRLDISERI